MSENKNFEQLHSDWRNITINQLSITNNVLLTFSTGFLVYNLNGGNFYNFHINTGEAICYPKMFFIFSILLLIFSILYGIAVLFTRLYDFRITRNIVFARSRTNNKLKYNDHDDFNSCDRIVGLYKILFEKLPFLTRDDAKKGIENVDFVKKFNDMEKLSKILGTSSWLWTKFQVLSLTLSFIFYIIYIFTK